jgi:hypothetical protein
MLNNLTNWKVYDKNVSGTGEFRVGVDNTSQWDSKTGLVTDRSDWSGFSMDLPDVNNAFDSADDNYQTFSLSEQRLEDPQPEYLPMVIQAYRLPDFPCEAMKKIRLTFAGKYYYFAGMGVEVGIPFEVWYWNSVTETATKVGEYTHTANTDTQTITFDCPCDKYINTDSWITFYLVNKNPSSDYVSPTDYISLNIDYAKIEVLADLHISQTGIAGDLSIYGDLKPQGTMNMTTNSATALSCEDVDGTVLFNINNTPSAGASVFHKIYSSGYLIDLNYGTNQIYSYQNSWYITQGLMINTNNSAEFALALKPRNSTSRFIYTDGETSVSSTAFSNANGYLCLFNADITSHTQGAGRRTAVNVSMSSYRTKVTSNDYTLVSHLARTSLIDNANYGCASGTVLRLYGNDNYFNPTITSARISGTCVYAGTVAREAENDVSGTMLNFALLTKGKTQLVGNLLVGSSMDALGTEIIDANAFFRPKSSADASAPNNSIYYSTTASKLVYKDSGGTVNNLY